MLHITFTLNALLMVAMPVILCFLLARRFGAGWGLAGVGALTFIGSQVVHLPLLWGLDYFVDRFVPIPEEWGLLFNAVVLGLLAGLCEEVARYIVYRRFIPSARTWKQALMFGAGHGGIEAIILGVLAGLTLANMLVLRNMDLTTLPNVPADQLPLLQQQVADFWSAPWYLTLLGAVERVFALCFHLSATVLVLQAFTRHNVRWLIAAILWHAVIDGVAVFFVGTWGPYWTEGAIGIMAVFSLGIIVALRDSGRGAAVSESASTGATGSVK